MSGRRSFLPWLAVVATFWTLLHVYVGGHLPGGQFFPFNLLVRLFQPFVAGVSPLARNLTTLYGISTIGARS